MGPTHSAVVCWRLGCVGCWGQQVTRPATTADAALWGGVHSLAGVAGAEVELVCSFGAGPVYSIQSSPKGGQAYLRSWRPPALYLVAVPKVQPLAGNFKELACPSTKQGLVGM